MGFNSSENVNMALVISSALPTETEGHGKGTNADGYCQGNL